MNIEWKHQVIPSCKDGPDFSSLPETGGNYAIFYLEMASLHYRCIYVGKAENLKKRAQQHWSDSETNTEMKAFLKQTNLLCFFYALVDADNKRDGIEAFLYNYYKVPKFNNNKPQAPQIIVNVPV
jgi:excinuclease UvrABC nuclease subunit